MSCTVVDLLEVVAVDDEEAQRQPLLLGEGERALEPLLETARLRIRVSGSVTALRRSRWSAKAASSDAATCAASTAAVSSRPGSTCGESPLIDHRAELAALARSGSQTTERLPGPRAAPSSSTWQTTLVRFGASDVQLVR